MSVLIDLMLVAIIALCGWRGWRAGLIRGVVGLVALVASIFIANVVATAYSGEFTGMLKPFASGVVDTIVSEALLGETDEDGNLAAAEDTRLGPPTVSTPEFDIAGADARGLVAHVLERVGLSDVVARQLAESVAGEGERIASGLAARITDKLCAILAYIAVFLVCFLLLAIIFAVIGNLINLAFSLPGLDLVNSIAGAVFGVMKGLVLVFTLAIALRYFGIITSDTVEKTALLRYIVNINPVANILGL